jgi:hypothetical protein
MAPVGKILLVALGLGLCACQENTELQEVRNAVTEMKKNLGAEGSSLVVAGQVADSQTDKSKAGAASGKAAPASVFSAEEASILGALEEQIAIIAGGCDGKEKEKACAKDFAAAVTKGGKTVKAALKKIKKPAPEFGPRCKELTDKRDDLLGKLPKSLGPKLKPKSKGFDAALKKFCK